MQIDSRMASSFLTALHSGPYVFQTFSDNDTVKQRHSFTDRNGKVRDGLAKVLIGTLEDALPSLQALQDKGAGIFVQVNPGMARGAKGVTQIGCQFVDTDGAPIQPITSKTPPPHIITQSSSEKYHIYWRVEAHSDFALFTAVQSALATAFRTDPSVKNVDRVMRLPGTLHQKVLGSEFLVRCHIAEPPPVTYSSQSILSALKPAPSAASTSDMILSGTFELPDVLPPGDRTMNLVRYIGSLAGQGVSADKIRELVLRANIERCPPGAIPIPEETLEVEVFPAIDKFVPQPTVDSDNPPIPEPTTETLPVTELHDKGFAERVHLMYKGRLHYIYESKTWLLWLTDRHGARWSRSIDGGLTRIFWSVIQDLRDQAAEYYNESKARAAAFKKIDRLNSADGSAAAIKCLQSMPGVTLQEDRLDANRWLLGVRNGVVNLKTGEIREARPEDLITVTSNVMADPAAGCPMWKQFISEIMDGDPEMVKYLQRLAGYLLTGDISLQQFYIFHGTGANGKSTFISIIEELLGDMAAPINASLFTGDSRFASDEYQLAALKEKRAVFISETESNAKLKESLVKMAASGERIPGRHPFGRQFTFTPTFKPILITNHKPLISNMDHGLWRRIRYIPFTVRIPEDKRDIHLTDKLCTELPGILNWCIEGCLEYQRRGDLGDPEAVIAATNAYKRESDDLQQFFTANCKQGGTVAMSMLYLNYESWKRARNEFPISRRRFHQDLEQRGIKMVQQGREIIVHGVSLGGVMGVA